MKDIISLFNVTLVVFSMMSVSCETKDEQHVKQEESKAVKIELNVTKKEHQGEKDLLNQLGFEFKDEKIIIDINKTSNFFIELESEMQKKAEEIELKISNAEINMSQDMGIKIEGDHIGIDLNRTKNILQQINILMKDILLDVNKSKY